MLKVLLLIFFSNECRCSTREESTLLHVNRCTNNHDRSHQSQLRGWHVGWAYRNPGGDVPTSGGHRTMLWGEGKEVRNMRGGGGEPIKGGED